MNYKYAFYKLPNFFYSHFKYFYVVYNKFFMFINAISNKKYKKSNKDQLKFYCYYVRQKKKILYIYIIIN